MGRGPANEKPLPTIPTALASSQDDLPGPPELTPPAEVKTSLRQPSGMYPPVSPVTSVVYEIPPDAAVNRDKMPRRKCSFKWIVGGVALAAVLVSALLFVVIKYGGYSFSDLLPSRSTASELSGPSSTTPFFKSSFESIDKLAFGGDFDAMVSRENVVLSPLALQYSMAVLGHFGTNLTRNAITKSFFKGYSLSQTTDYLSEVKFRSMPWFFTVFLVGNNPSSKLFATSIAKHPDGTPFYPTGVYSYSNYFNLQVQKGSYNNDTFVAPFDKELDSIARPNHLIGFSSVQQTLHFQNRYYPLVPNQKFKSAQGEKTLDMFQAKVHHDSFSNFEFYRLAFADARYVLFFAVPHEGKALGSIDLVSIGSALKKNSGGSTHICIPQFSFQKTLKLDSLIKSAVKNETLTLKLDKNIDDYALENYYQVVRFDLSALGLNVAGKAAAVSLNCEKKIDRSFKFGVYFNEKGQEAMLFYGSF